MSKSTILLVDAGVVIEAFRVGAWDVLVSRYNIALSDAIVGESIFYKDDEEKRYDIDLSGYVDSGKIQVISVSVADVYKFRDGIGATVFERIDFGEMTLLYHLFEHISDEMLIASGDGVVYRILGKHAKSEKGVSLEKLLIEIGHPTSKLKQQFTQKFKDVNCRKGFDDFCV
jgi:hypothetical protein